MRCPSHQLSRSLLWHPKGRAIGRNQFGELNGALNRENRACDYGKMSQSLAQLVRNARPRLFTWQLQTSV